MIKQITNFIKILNSDVKEEEIALGIVLGLFAGFLSIIPFNFILVFILLLILKANFSMFFVSFAIFKLISFAIDPLGDVIGYFVLKLKFLHSFFSFLSSIPLMNFTQFNYSVVMGDFILAIVLTPFIYILSIKLVKNYREKLKEKVQKFKIVQALNLTNFFKIDKEG